MSHAMFRLVIVGAALAYQNPLIKALKHPDPEIRALARATPLEHPLLGSVDDPSQKELAFLLQFAVCDLIATLKAQDAVFGHSEWLLDSILSDKESRQAVANRFKQGYGRAGFCVSHQEEERCP